MSKNLEIIRKDLHKVTAFESRIQLVLSYLLLVLRSSQNFHLNMHFWPLIIDTKYIQQVIYII